MIRIDTAIWGVLGVFEKKYHAHHFNAPPMLGLQKLLPFRQRARKNAT
ncbi:MAG: hypothetical protein V5B39_12630 [Accumulibacter sp.]|jgi:hypothetical protein